MRRCALVGGWEYCDKAGTGAGASTMVSQDRGSARVECARDVPESRLVPNGIRLSERVLSAVATVLWKSAGRPRGAIER